MADVRKIVPECADGDFFVDSTCIDCDTCRQLAPEVFAAADEYSYVHTQPRDPGSRRSAFRALLACPTGSIGTARVNEASRGKEDFPLPPHGPGSYCG